MSRIVLAACAAVLVAACAAPPQTGPPQERPQDPPVGHRTWLAVFETAADPGDLDAATAELLGRVEDATVVSPAGCFASGLRRVPDHHYVLGVVAETEQALGEVVAASGREPSFAGEVVDTCAE